MWRPKGVVEKSEIGGFLNENNAFVKAGKKEKKWMCEQNPYVAVIEVIIHRLVPFRKMSDIESESR